MNATAVWLLLLPLLAGSLGARDFYLSPTGAGQRDGSSWENAFESKKLGTVVNETLQPGDRLLLAGGTYSGTQLVIDRGGERGKPKIIEGVDHGQGLPIFNSQWSIEDPAKGATAIEFKAGVSEVTFKHLRLHGYAVGVYAAPVKTGTARTHLVFDDVDIEHCRHGFYLSDCDDLELQNCDLRRYSKHGFRFELGCNRVRLQGCVADCSAGDAEWEKKTELFPFGFLLNDAGAPNTAFVFTECIARNNLMPLQTTSYKNGDGFVVEENSANVVFERCRSLRNQDGGFDLKVRDVRLTDCVSSGNYRDYRIWTTATLTNCFAGWATTGLWCNGGPVEVRRSTFHQLKDEAVRTDKSATLPVTLSDCIISATDKPADQRVAGEVVLRETIVVSGADSDPQYIRPAAGWDGSGDAMNSQAFPAKGYQRSK